MDVELGTGKRRKNEDDDEELEEWGDDDDDELSKNDIIHLTWAAITFCVMGCGLVFPGMLIMAIADTAESKLCETPIVSFLVIGGWLTVIYVGAVIGVAWMAGSGGPLKEWAGPMRTVLMPMLSLCCILWLLSGARWVRDEQACAGSTVHTLARMAAGMPLLTFPCCCTYFWLPTKRYG